MKGANFVSGLKAHFERAAPILPAVEMDYWRWIKKHAIKAPELEKLYDNLLESCKFMPSIEELTEHLHAIRSGQIKNAIFQVFTINGVRYARRVKTGESPSLPDGATDSKLAIPPELQAKQTREYCSLEEGRNWFMRGWVESGADPDRCLVMFGVLVKPKDEHIGELVPI